MSEAKIKVQVLFFGACREAVALDETSCELAAPATVANVWEALKASYPALASFERSALFAVNEEHSRPNQAIHSGDVLAIFPPVSGG